jgi:GLPGLI family protein
MSRVQTVSGPMVITQIDRPDDKVKIMLFEMMDKKAGMTIKDTIPENDSTENYDISIDYSGDTKVIAGYTCKKAVVTFTPREGVDAEEVTVAVFYSDELDDGSSNAENDYKGIPGLLLEFYQVTPKITTKYVATEVKKGGVKELDFFFPSDYKEFKSEEELIKYFQG